MIENNIHTHICHICHGMGGSGLRTVEDRARSDHCGRNPRDPLVKGMVDSVVFEV